MLVTPYADLDGMTGRANTSWILSVMIAAHAVAACSAANLRGDFTKSTKAESDKGARSEDHPRPTKDGLDQPSDENILADEPVQTSGAFLVCGRSFEINEDACAMIDTATHKRKSCGSFGDLSLVYADGTSMTVTPKTTSPTSFWHFKFSSDHNQTLIAAQTESLCAGISESSVTLNTNYGPPLKANGEPDLEATIIASATSFNDPDLVLDIEDEDKFPQGNTILDETPIRIFVTSKKFQADLGRRRGANKKCQDAAESAGLEGKYRALLSKPGSSVREVFINKQSVLNMKGELVSNAGDIWQGSLMNAVKYDENIQPVNGPVWTASTHYGGFRFADVNGVPPGACKGWRSGEASRYGYVGDPQSTSSTWIETPIGIPCSEQAHLYCISHRE